jgi:hypothetical protein
VAADLSTGGADDRMTVWEKSGDAPECDLGSRHVDAQVGTQPDLHPFDAQPSNMVHVHVGKHHVGHGWEVDAGGLQSLGQMVKDSRRFADSGGWG